RVWETKEESDGKRIELISEKIGQINAALGRDKKAPVTGLSTANQNELTGKLTSEKDPAKKIYDAFNKADQDTKTDGIYTALKLLIGKLTDKSSWEDKPKTLKTDFASGDNEKAWKFVNEQTKTDSSYSPDG